MTIDEDGGPMIGPARPPPAAEMEPDGEVIMGPPRPQPPSSWGREYSGEESGSGPESDGEAQDTHRVPVCNEIVLREHAKSFRQPETFEGYQVRSISWSPTVREVLVCNWFATG